MPLLQPQRLVPLGLAALALSAAAEARAADRPPLRDADYWAIADRVVVGLQPAWDERRGAYVSDWQGAAARTNANMLVVHALAARHHHRGPARADERARRLVDHMTHAPMARHGGPAARHRSVCWTAQLDSSKTDHISVDPQIAEALDEAWSARRALGLSRARRAAIRAVARRCARHTQWRFPYVLLNQINWNAQLYAHLAHLTGHHSLLRHDYRRHLTRFIAAFRRPLPGLRDVEPRSRLRLPLQPLPVAVRRAQLRHARVREPRRLRLRLLPARPRGRDAGTADARPAPRPRVADAAVRGLVDPRGLPELGHRLRARPLALGPVLALRAAGAADARHRARRARGPAARALGEGGLRPRSAALPPLGGGSGLRPRAEAPVRRPLRAPRLGPVREPRGRERAPGGAARARAQSARPIRRRCTRSTPRTTGSP